jgi:hypothetical protein
MSKPLFYQCVVLDNQDPLMLGRVRARIVTDNYEDILKSVENWNPETDPWTSKDPLIFNPLLPYFVYQVPKIEELIQVFFLNTDFKYQNQYYVQNGFSTPTATFKEFNFGGNKFTGTGLQISPSQPLKNKDGSYSNGVTKGVFPEPGDNAILGRGSADLVVKQDEILLRAGKFKGDILQPNIPPVGNVNRGFLQLTRFGSTKETLNPKTYFELKENVVLTNYLIEWSISNPENTQDKFTGSVYLYQLKPDASVNTKNLTVGSVVIENLKKLVYRQNFTLLSKSETIKFINDFIKTCNSNNFSSTGDRLFPSNQGNSKFPIFFRPSNLMYNKLKTIQPTSNSSSISEAKNISEIYKGIKLNSADQGGYGFILTKDNVSLTTPLTPVKVVVPQTKTIPGETTYGALASDKLFLLSHKSQIPGKDKINLNNTLYGIPSDVFADQIIPNTSSMVRGEELLELINLIVRFLVSHTHAYPGLAPVSVTEDGSNVSNILQELQNAYTKILNENIRIN